MSKDEIFMRLAIEQAHLARRIGEVPVGAVITDEKGNILSQTHNKTETDINPTAHAEVIAISEASRKRGDRRLTGTTLYVTIEPCVMCMGAVVLARIDRLVFGARDDKAGAVFSVYKMGQDGRLNHMPEIREAVYETECASLMKDFFNKLRSEG